jgi:hypothetical protein
MIETLSDPGISPPSTTPLTLTPSADRYHFAPAPVHHREQGEAEAGVDVPLSTCSHSTIAHKRHYVNSRLVP